MFAVCAIAAMCLMSVGHSAPMVCERLVHPLDQPDPHRFEGKWALVAGSLDNTSAMEALRLRDSITMYFTNSSNASSISYTQVNRFGDLCQHRRYNISVQESSFIFDTQRFELTGAFLHTSCPDCLVMRWNVKSRRRSSMDLYLLSRRRELEQREMEEFRDQLRCYGLPVPVVMDPTRELCPEQLESTPTAAAQTEIKIKIKIKNKKTVGQ